MIGLLVRCGMGLEDDRRTFSNAQVCRPSIVLAIPAAVDVVETAGVLEVGAINGKLVKGVELSFEGII